MRRWALLALTAGALASLPWLVHGYRDPTLYHGDGAVYVRTAQSLWAGEGYRYLGEPFAIRPPGLPVLLGPVLAAFGADPRALNAYVSLWGVLAVALAFAFYERRLGVFAALALAAAVWLNPGFREASSQVLSDVPGLALLFGCLLLERWAAERPDWRRAIAVGLAIGLAGYVRTILLLLAPAAAAARAGAKGRALPGRARALGAAIVLLTPLLVQAPWLVRNARVERSVPSEHTLFYSYGAALWHTDKGDPASPRIGADALWRRVKLRVRQVTNTLGSRVRSPEANAGHTALGALGMLALVVVGLRRREPAELFALGALAVAFTYFGFTTRLVLPLYVLALGALAQMAFDPLRSRWGERRAGLAVAAALTALALADFRPRAGWDEIAARDREFEQVVAYLREHAPPDVPLGADFGGHYAVALGRDVYSLRWSVMRGGAEGGLEFATRHRLGALVLDDRNASDRRLLARLGGASACEARIAAHFCIARIRP